MIKKILHTKKFKHTVIAFFSLVFAVMLISSYFSILPKPLFDKPGTSVLYSNEGRILNARTADDEQWRLPYNESVPEKFTKSILLFEDKHFFSHRGVNPFSMIRAALQNLRSGRIISGGSTISMQVIRLSRQGRARTIKEKIIEIFLAELLEYKYSKNEILALYASNAPFGGNVVGLDAACWRYFGHSPDKISWGEAATLAVLPNSPSLVHPGKNRKALKTKRDNLLKKLHIHNILDSLELKLAMSEKLPDKPHAFPQQAPHLFERIRAEGKRGSNIYTSIHTDIQLFTNKLALEYYKKNSANQINNIAILVAETKSGNILAYTGNVYDQNYNTPEMHVDLINSLRSPGSLLKPFLYAAMLSDGLILPNTLIEDIPTNFKGFSPENFNRTYDGAVPASRALSRSLNVPAVKMLQNYSTDKFLDILEELGFTTLSKPASHYGLSIILGGGEITLWEVTSVFASFGRALLNYNNTNNYNEKIFRPLNYYKHKNNSNVAGESQESYTLPISASAIYHTANSLKEVNRPEEEIFWRDFSSMFPVAWKTGTSYGYRDAWAIGVTPEYTVGIWVGNASGEGRPGLTGINAAAPVLFDVFKYLRPKKWFNMPYDDMKQIAVCKYSGHRAGRNCHIIDSVWVPLQGLNSPSCPYHKTIHTDKDERFRVNQSCEQLQNIVSKPWFILPPVQEYYFKQKNPFYKQLPPVREDCSEHTNIAKNMDIIYPPKNAGIYIPIELDGSAGEVVFRLAHRQSDTEVHWHIDNEYITTTKVFHEISVRPSEGNHILTIVDKKGETITREFEVFIKH